MFKRLIASAMVFGVAALAPPAVHAQVACAPRDQIVERLKNNFGEDLRGRGLQSESSLIELWMSAETGTWTIMTTRPDGFSCILVHGKHWRHIDPPPKLGTGVSQRPMPRSVPGR